MSAHATGPGWAGLAAGVLASGLALWGARAPQVPTPATPAGTAEAPPRPGPAPQPSADARVVTGRVLSDDGAPVAGAEVVAWVAPAEDAGAYADSPVASGRTDEDGRYRLTGLPRRPLRLVARGAGHAPATASLPGAAIAAPTLRLAAGALLAGQVLRPDGRPASGAAVTLVGSALWPAETLSADADGRFRRVDLPPGIYMLRARLEGDATSRSGLRITPDRPADLSLRLAPGARVGGTVRDERGEAVPGAELTLAEGGLSPLPRRAQADDAGAFSLAGLLPGRHTMEVRAPGHVPTRMPLTLDAGATERLTVELVRGATVAGRVLDAQGRPLEGARVRFAGAEPRLAAPPVPGSLGVTAVVPPLPLFGVVESESWSGLLGAWHGGESTTSEADGRFELSGLTAGAGEVVAEAPGLAPALSAGLRLRAGETRDGLELQLSEGARLEGRVLDARGFPAEGVVVTLRAEREPAPRTQAAPADGTFTFDGVLGRVTLTARAAALPPAREELVLEEGGRREIELRLPEALATLEGRLVDEDDAPVSFAVLALEAENPRTPARRTTPTRIDGTFRLDGLPAPPWRLHAEVRGFVPLDLRLERVPEGPLELRLARPVALTIRVRDNWTGEPPAAGELRVTGERMAERVIPLAEEGPGGRLRLEGLAAGDRVTIVAEHPDRLPASAEVVAGEVDELVLLLEAAGALRGAVVDRFGAPAPGARVRVAEQGAETTTGEDGTFRLSGVRPGLVTLDVTAPGEQVSVASGPHRVDPLGTTPGLRISLPVEAGGASAGEGADDHAEIATGVAISVATRNGVVRVVGVAPGSDAARRGIRPGDALVAVDGEPVLVAGQARSALRGPPGTRAVLTLRRGGRRVRRTARRERHVVPPVP